MSREIIPRHRRTPAELADKKASLLSIIGASARNGHVCPSLAQLAALLRLNPKVVHALLNSLRNERAISWSIVFGFGGAGQRVRVVTIKATGAKTALPGAAKQRARPAKPGPIFIGPPVRDLRTADPAEFTARKAELEARDQAQRERAV